MLLEFTEDTDELSIHDRALELRKRVAGRKLQRSVEEGVVDANVLLEMKEKNRDEKQEQSKVRVNLIHAEIKDRVALARAEQHLAAEGQVRVLGRDIARASRLGKARLDTLSDLEKRIINMRSQLQRHLNEPADEVVDRELRANNKLLKLEKKFTECSFCSRRIISELIDTHRNMCQKNPKNCKEIVTATAKFVVPDTSGTPSSSSSAIAAFLGTAPGSDMSPSATSSFKEQPITISKKITLPVEAEAPLEPHGISDHRADVLSLNLVDTTDHNLITTLATYKPQPVRNCRLKSKGIGFIEWEWEPPVINGGLEITNYEISFHGKFQEFNHDIGRYKKWEEHYPSLLTSTWVFPENPVCHTGFKITGLRGGAEYSQFKIRCCNLRGWSEWTDMMLDHHDYLQEQEYIQKLKAKEKEAEIGSVTSSSSNANKKKKGNGNKFMDKIVTDDPIPPTPPLFVNCEKITSTCIHISWSPPYFDGGVPIVDFIVYYTVRLRVLTVTARDVIVEKHKSFSTRDGMATSAVIRNLPDDTDIINVYVCAMNSSRLLGAKGHLKQSLCRTLQCSRFTLLKREFDFAANTKGDFVDSSFYTGVKQRLSKVDHMKKLQEEIDVTPPDPLELEEAKEWEAIVHMMEEEKLAKEASKFIAISSAESVKSSVGTVNEDDPEVQKILSGDNDPSGFSYKQRKQHYEHKIKKLEKEIEALNSERMAIDRRRLEHTHTMRAKEQRLLVITLERERLKLYRGSVITSGVLTGADTQYNTDDYRKRIELAYEQVIKDIATLKFEVIDGENRRQVIKKELTEVEELRKTRLANFLEFEKKAYKLVTLMKRLNLGGKKGIGGGSSNDSQSSDTIDSYERTKLLQDHFLLFKEFVQERIKTRYRIIDMFHNMMMRLKSQAFRRWKFGPEKNDAIGGTGRRGGAGHGSSGHEDQIISVGGVMLEKAYEKRLEFQESLREMINSTASVQQKLVLSKLSKDSRKQMTQLRDFKYMEEGIDHNTLYLKGMKLLYEGDGYVKEGRFELALSMYDAQILWLRSKPTFDIKLLSICHGRLGRMFLHIGNFARAVVEFDRQLSLAREIQDKCEECDAFFGLGDGYLHLYDYDNAIRYLTIAQAQLVSLGRVMKYKQCLQLLKQCYEKLYKDDKVQVYAEKLSEIDEGMTAKVKMLHDKLDDMKLRLVHTAAEIELIIPIERTTYRALELKHIISSNEDRLKELEQEIKVQDERICAVEMILDAIQTEMAKALDCDEPEMWSELVHDQPQIVEIEELKTRLKARSVVELKKLQEENAIKKQILVRISNVENNIIEADQQLTVEEGNLMKHSHTSKPFRSVGLCTTNAAGNEVTGTATGGFEFFAASEGNHIHLIDYHNGELSHIYVGGKEETGHTGVITCLLHDGAVLYSGATDERILCWNTETYKLIRIMTGHEGSIVALASEAKYLVSSSSDNTMRLWNKHTGEHLRVIYGHGKSVLSLEIGPTWLLTGSADHEARVWTIVQKSKKTTVVECSHRLIGHHNSVTCVKYGAIEVMTGDQLGRIFIWWMKTGKIIRQCQVHEGPVKCLQFDSVHIVSGGVDNVVCIVDIATGEVLQKLRGHTGPVLSLAFDSERILSVGSDNTIRYWQWGKKSGPQDKFHVIEPGETLAMIAKRNNLGIDTLMKWNGIRNATQVTQGKKIIVKKGDPNVLTDAEKQVIEQELRRIQNTEWAAKKMKKLNQQKQNGFDTGGLQMPSHDPYRRVHSLVTDIDNFSLANRLFGQEKRKLDLFPDTTFLNADKYTLAGRLMQKAEGDGDNGDNDDMDGWAGQRKSKVRTRYFISENNEDEWGHVADDLGRTMLDMMLELVCYEIIIEQKKELRSTQTVLGRIFKHQKQLTADRAKQEQLLLENAALAAIEDSNKDGKEGENNDASGLQILHRIDEERDEEAAQNVKFDPKMLENLDANGEETGVIKKSVSGGFGDHSGPLSGRPVSGKASSGGGGLDNSGARKEAAKLAEKRKQERKEKREQEKQRKGKKKGDDSNNGGLPSDSEGETPSSVTLPALHATKKASRKKDSKDQPQEDIHLPPISTTTSS